MRSTLSVAPIFIIRVILVSIILIENVHVYINSYIIPRISSETDRAHCRLRDCRAFSVKTISKTLKEFRIIIVGIVFFYGL